LLEPTRAERIRRVGRDCAITVTGYISGNLLISAICGVLTYAALKICGVPFSGLIALFVALADLIPMVGATLGAVVAAIAGFVHSVPVGIVVVVFLGALLAIPVAGIIQVVVRDVWDNRRSRPKQRPTVGEDRAPVDTRPGAEPE
jgi:predicted PurR-regulated permease PerM